jgi:hypothetical protein
MTRYGADYFYQIYMWTRDELAAKRKREYRLPNIQELKLMQHLYDLSVSMIVNTIANEGGNRLDYVIGHPIWPEQK